MSCHKGGLSTLRHNEIRDLAAELQREVCHNVSVEPGLQVLDGERIRPRTANREDEAIMAIRGSSSKGPCGLASDIPLASFEGKVGP